MDNFTGFLLENQKGLYQRLNESKQLTEKLSHQRNTTLAVA
jgi:hypothetical protein